jgi:hypothetical protein
MRILHLPLKCNQRHAHEQFCLVAFRAVFAPTCARNSNQWEQREIPSFSDYPCREPPFQHAFKPSHLQTHFKGQCARVPSNRSVLAMLSLDLR